MVGLRGGKTEQKNQNAKKGYNHTLTMMQVRLEVRGLLNEFQNALQHYHRGGIMV